MNHTTTKDNHATTATEAEAERCPECNHADQGQGYCPDNGSGDDPCECANLFHANDSQQPAAKPSSHSTGNPACPALEGGRCEIEAHNVDAATTTAAEHSPSKLPWNVRGFNEKGASVIGGQHQETIADVYGFSSNRSEANAYLIVTAVNEREAMVEALKGVAIMLNTSLEKYDSEPWAQRVRAVLERVGGER